MNIYVRRLDTREIVHTVPVKGANISRPDKIVAGMLINMDRERFFVDDSECDAVSD